MFWDTCKMLFGICLANVLTVLSFFLILGLEEIRFLHLYVAEAYLYIQPSMSDWQHSHLEKQGIFSRHLWFVWLPVNDDDQMLKKEGLELTTMLELLQYWSSLNLCSHFVTLCHLIRNLEVGGVSMQHDWSAMGVFQLHDSPSVGMGECCTWSPDNVFYQKLKRESTQELLKCNMCRQVVCAWLHSQKTMRLLFPHCVPTPIPALIVSSSFIYYCRH